MSRHQLFMQGDPLPAYPCRIGDHERSVYCDTCEAAPNVYVERDLLRALLRDVVIDYGKACDHLDTCECSMARAARTVRP